jgi:hypothetical protein
MYTNLYTTEKLAEMKVQEALAAAKHAQQIRSARNQASSKAGLGTLARMVPALAAVAAIVKSR